MRQVRKVEHPLAKRGLVRPLQRFSVSHLCRKLLQYRCRDTMALWCGGQERQHERSSRERQGIGAVVGSHFIGLGEADCYAVNLQRRGR